MFDNDGWIAIDGVGMSPSPGSEFRLLTIIFEAFLISTQLQEEFSF